MIIIKSKLHVYSLFTLFILLTVYYSYYFLFQANSNKIDVDPVPRIDQLIILFSIGFFFLYSGFYCYTTKPHSVITKYYFYLMFMTGIAIISAIPSGFKNILAQPIEVISVLFTPVCLLHFFLLFPSTTKPKLFKWLYVTLNNIVLCFSIIYFFATIFRRFHNPLTDVSRYLILFVICTSLVLCIVLISLMLKSNSAKVKNQLYILIASFCLSFFPVIFLSLIPYIFFASENHIPFYYSLISVIIFPISVTYMLTRQEIIDIRIKFMTLLSKTGIIILSLILTNNLLFLFFQDHLDLFFRINLLMSAAIIIFIGFNQFFSSRSYRHKVDKTQEIKRETHRIMQQVLNGQHLTSCARLIVNLIQQTIVINGACLVWKQNQIPKIYYQTGIFSKGSLTLKILNSLNSDTKETIQKKMDVTILSLSDQESIKGWIFLGQKKNGTRFEKNEFALIDGICADALNLLNSSEVLSQMDTELEKTRSLSYSHEHFNQLLMNSIDESRRDLSIFLHDEILQNVILLENRIDGLHHSHKIDQAAYREIKESLLNTIYEIREKSRELHPFIVEDLGLQQSVQALKKRLQNNYNVIVDTSFDLGMKIIPKRIELAAFRMVKELLHNSIKHASIPVVSVSLKCTDYYLLIIVSDHGKGFNLTNMLSTASGHIGLLSVQKSVDLMHGLFDIQSSSGNGTTINITLPLDWNDGHDNQHHLSG